MKTKAAVTFGTGQPFEIHQIDVAPLQADEIRIAMVASGVCHTDAVARDLKGVFPLPGVLGHEGSGIVEAIGKDVSTVQVGDHVVLSFANCHRCDHCLSGHPTVCTEFNPLNFGGFLAGGQTPYSLDGQPLSIFFGQSSFSQTVVTKADNVVVVDKEVDLELLGPLGCGIQTGAGTVLNRLRPKANEGIVIFGAGAVGLSAIMAAQVVGCYPIIAVDVHDHRLKLAQELGATHIINGSKVDTVAEIHGLTRIGVPYAVETTGVPTVVKQALAAIKPLGVVAIVGFTGDVTFNIQTELMAEGKSLIGVIEGDSIPKIFIPQLISLYKQGKFPFDRLVQFYDLEQINQAFEDSASGAVIKPILRMQS